MPFRAPRGRRRVAYGHGHRCLSRRHHRTWLHRRRRSGVGGRHRSGGRQPRRHPRRGALGAPPVRLVAGSSRAAGRRERIRDADRMRAACDAAGALLVINHQGRFNPNYRALRDRVAAGGLGDLTSVALRWGAGRLGNVGTHKLDAVELLTGRRITAVSGTLDLAGKPDCRGPAFHDPGGWGVLRLEGGLMGVVDATDYATAPARIEINGTLGTASSGREEVTIEPRDGRREEWPGRRRERTSMDRAVGEIVDWLSTGARSRTRPRGGPRPGGARGVPRLARAPGGVGRRPARRRRSRSRRQHRVGRRARPLRVPGAGARRPPGGPP